MSMVVTQKRYRTLWRRILAAVIDTAVIYPIALLEYFVVKETTPVVLVIGLFALSYLSYHVYTIAMHARFGQTLGKMAAGVKVMNSEETAISNLKEAFARESVYLVGSLFCVGWLAYDISVEGFFRYHDYSWGHLITMMVFGLWVVASSVAVFCNSKRRALHDYLAGTVVVSLAGSSAELSHQSPDPKLSTANT